jgi:splicing factor 3B subunit 5
MNERFNIQNQWEHLQNKYVGTGHADYTKWEWGTNIQRDSIASHLGHFSRLLYMSQAENESIGRMKHTLLMKMIRPCGPPPEKTEKDDLL